jgi:hypothetical protein
MEKDETIGYHKGSLATLIKEREGLMQLLSVVDQLIQAHKKALEDLGVNLNPPKQEEEEQERAP